ncbi:putative extensin family protein [Rhizobium mesoamericanum STM3625]|uniref:Putative extensin family protein n=1 Tax=Rhizobium mesoamericanum STM3625 TaxID=1211777 RepID=K0PYP2_9HYPH|nr:putative extensin family protein [Rhizobium mesoamericanum STM3625]
MILAALSCIGLLASASLPKTGPQPQIRPVEPGSSPQAPTPSPKPESKSEPKPEPRPEPRPEPKPEPRPEPKPDRPDAGAASSEPPATDTSTEPEKQGPKLPSQQTLEEQHLTVAAESDEVHSECIKELQALGVAFKDISRIDDGNGCGIDKPIKVTEVLPGIKIKPDAVFRCQVALALARWMKESVIPAASVAAANQGRIVAVNQASSYVCRLRNGAETGKVSEHARGNAIDIASFSFEEGKDIAVLPRREDPTLIGAFQRTISAAGCLYFTTVLDPESDAAHETHFHLDVLERNGGYRYCH